MTFNGSDFVNYSFPELEKILENTLNQGTRFGWEFVSIMPSSQNNFCLYNDDWTPKKVMQVVDEHWEDWLDKINEIEKNKK